jgi:hypothetical protein
VDDKILFESLAPELGMIEAQIRGQLYVRELPELRQKVAWGGAGVIIASAMPETSTETVVVTPLAREIAWFFGRIRDIAFQSQIIDYNSKFVFYRRLAKRVQELQAVGLRDDDPQAVLLDLLNAVRQMAIAWDDFNADS